MEGEPMEDRTVNGEVSPPSPNLCHSLSPSKAQWPSLRSHVSVHHLTSLLSGLCSRRRGIRSLGPRDPLREPVHSRSPEAHAPLCRAHYLWGIQHKPRPCWALTWPHPLSTQSVTNQGHRSLVKGVTRGHPFSKAAQQLWGEEWSPIIMVTSSKLPPSLNDLLAILGLYCNYLTVWGDAIINHSY